MTPLPLKQEFRAKCFGFIDFEAEDFARSQWNIGRRKFLAYRAFVFFYWTVFLVVDFATNQDKGAFCLYLSHWNEAQLSLFFGFALFCAVRYMWKTGSGRDGGSLSGEDSRCKDSPQSSSLDMESAVRLADGAKKMQDGASTDNPTAVRIRWYHGFTTMLYVTSLSISVAVTILYASSEMTESGDGAKRMSAGNFHLHFVNSLLIIADFFLNCIPIRLLHFVYVSIFTVLYCLLLFLLHATGVNSAMYRIVDWKSNTTWALAFSVGMVFLIAPATHSGMFFLQRGVRLLSSRSGSRARRRDSDDTIKEDLHHSELLAS